MKKRCQFRCAERQHWNRRIRIAKFVSTQKLALSITHAHIGQQVVRVGFRSVIRFEAIEIEIVELFESAKTLIRKICQSLFSCRYRSCEGENRTHCADIRPPQAPSRYFLLNRRQLIFKKIFLLWLLRCRRRKLHRPKRLRHRCRNFPDADVKSPNTDVGFRLHRAR